MEKRTKDGSRGNPERDARSAGTDELVESAFALPGLFRVGGGFPTLAFFHTDTRITPGVCYSCLGCASGKPQEDQNPYSLKGYYETAAAVAGDYGGCGHAPADNPARRTA